MKHKDQLQVIRNTYLNKIRKVVTGKDKNHFDDYCSLSCDEQTFQQVRYLVSTMESELDNLKQKHKDERRKQEESKTGS